MRGKPDSLFMDIVCRVSPPLLVLGLRNPTYDVSENIDESNDVSSGCVWFPICCGSVVYSYGQILHSNSLAQALGAQNYLGRSSFDSSRHYSFGSGSLAGNHVD